jgi:hypothetical protein
MKKTLDRIKEYLELGDNIYLLNLVKQLEIDIKIEILQAEVNQINKFIKK